MPTFKLMLLENGSCNDFDEVTSSVHNESIETAVHRIAQSYGFEYEVISVQMLMAGGARKVTVNLSAVAAMVRQYEVVIREVERGDVSQEINGEVGEFEADATPNTVDNESSNSSTVDAHNVTSTPVPPSTPSNLSEPSTVTATSKTAKPTTPIRITKNVSNAVLTPKLKEISLDSLYKDCNYDVFRSAVQTIKNGGIPNAKGRKSVIKTLATVLSRHCQKEDHPTMGETGAFFLQLMQPYGQMLQVYEDWAGRPRGSYLMVCVENSRKTKKKRGLIPFRETKMTQKTLKTRSVASDDPTVIEKAVQLSTFTDLRSLEAQQLVSDTFEYRISQVSTMEAELIYEKFSNYFYDPYLLKYDFQHKIYKKKVDFGRKWALISSKFISAVEKDDVNKTKYDELKGWHEHFETAHDKRCFHGFLALYVLSNAAYGRKSDKFDQAYVNKLGEFNIETAIKPYKRREFPFIIQLSEGNNNFYVRFFGRHVLVEGSFSDALEVYLATFWVFELSYPNTIKYFLKVLESFIDIEPPPKKPWSPTLKELRRQILEAAPITESSADDE